MDVEEEEKEKREVDLTWYDVGMRKVQCRVQSSKAGGKERLIHDQLRLGENAVPLTKCVP
jgi:hypothetical protein